MSTQKIEILATAAAQEAYRDVLIKYGLEKYSMHQSHSMLCEETFWKYFHAAWGKSTLLPNYNKKTWGAVHADILSFFSALRLEEARHLANLTKDTAQRTPPKPTSSELTSVREESAT